MRRPPTKTNPQPKRLGIKLRDTVERGAAISVALFPAFPVNVLVGLMGAQDIDFHTALLKSVERSRVSEYVLEKQFFTHAAFVPVQHKDLDFRVV